MSIAFIILSAITILAALGTMLLRNAVHCALCLAVTFAGLAGLYLQLNAQFVGLVQILVYIGAVAVLIVFAILLTQNGEASGGTPVFSSTWWLGAAIATVLGTIMIMAVLSTTVPGGNEAAAPATTVLMIGQALLYDYVLPLEVIGLLLSANSKQPKVFR